MEIICDGGTKHMEEEAVTSKLKKIRKQKKLTLKDMSELTGFSISFLSQMERGISPVTLTSLKKITKALGISMKEIFHEEEASEDSVDIYTRKNPDVRLEGMQRNYKKMTVLSGHFSQRKMDIIHLIMEAEFLDFEESAHEGEEFYYVLKGNAQFVIDGVTYYVEQGKTIQFPSGKKHYVRNPGKCELELLCVLTPLIF